jgi:hypothetical protein
MTRLHPCAASLSIALLLVALVASYADDDGKSPQSRPHDGEGIFGHRAVRWVLSERPAFDPIVGGQEAGIVWSGADGTFHLPLPRGRGSTTLWLFDQDQWRLFDGIDLPADGDPSLSSFYTGAHNIPGEVTKTWACVLVERVVGMDRDKGSTIWITNHCEGATVRLIAGAECTPVWDAPTQRTDARGRARFGPLGEGDWYADIFFTGHTPIRIPIRTTEAPTEDDPSETMIFPAQEKVGRVETEGGALASGAMVRYRVLDCIGSVPVYIPVVDGSFTVSEPLSAGIRYTAELPGGRATVLERRGLPSVVILRFGAVPK